MPKRHLKRIPNLYQTEFIPKTSHIHMRMSRTRPKLQNVAKIRN